MKKRLISILFLLVYIIILIKVMVFKDIPTINIGHMMLNFGGAERVGQPNFIPLATILPYLLGYKGWIIGSVNLLGNIVPLLPMGLLVPLVYSKMTWKKSLVLAAISGLTIEVMQAVLRVGIFDIDDIILNALGVMIGYYAFIILAKWVRSTKTKNIIITTTLVIAVVALVGFYTYQKLDIGFAVGAGSNQINSLGNEQKGVIPQSGDLCGGTGGIGQIVSIGTNTFTIKRKDGSSQIVNFTDQTTIETPTGSAVVSDLKIGDSVTLVGETNPDKSFTAMTVLVCIETGPETQSG